MSVKPDQLALKQLNPEKVLGNQGLFAAKNPSFIPRAGQLELADQTFKAIEAGRILIAEAGTGTGKTYAYLVPALLSGQNIVISTYSRALQDQLIQKDLPAVFNYLNLPRSYMAQKGIVNYLCKKKLYKGKGRTLFADEVMEQLLAIAREADADLEKDSPEYKFADISIKFSPEIRKHFVCSRDQCTRKHCEYYAECFAYAARNKARKTRVVVINHALFFADLKIRISAKQALRDQEKAYMEEEAAAAAEAAETAAAEDAAAAADGEDSLLDYRGILPDYQAIIFDEAHKLPDAGRGVFADTVSLHGIMDIKNRLQELCEPKEAALTSPGGAPQHGKTGPAGKITLPNAVRDGYAGLKKTFEALHGYLLTYKQAQTRYGAPAEEYMFQEINHPENQEFRELTRTLQDQLAGYARDLAQYAQADEETIDGIRERLEKMCRTLERLQELDNPDSQDFSRSAGIVRIRERNFTFELTPLEISEYFGEFLQACLEEHIGAVFTSATLSTSSRTKNFTKFKMDTGMPEKGLREVQILSHFDYKTHAALYCSGDFPDTADRAREQKLIWQFRELISGLDGGTLILTTSNRAMNQMAGALRQLPGMNKQVFCQNDPARSLNTLINDFCHDGNAILIGTFSLWEGLDIPGRALSLVIIDKLPFPVPYAPLFKARCQAYEDHRKKDRKSGFRSSSFYGLSVPEAIIELRQGAGRLIRHEHDCGILIICDPRLITRARSYGNDFLASLPEMQQGLKLEQLLPFLRRARASIPASG